MDIEKRKNDLRELFFQSNNSDFLAMIVKQEQEMLSDLESQLQSALEQLEIEKSENERLCKDQEYSIKKMNEALEQNKEIIEQLILFHKIGKLPLEMFIENQDTIYHNSKILLEKMSGKSIEELLKE